MKSSYRMLMPSSQMFFLQASAHLFLSLLPPIIELGNLELINCAVIWLMAVSFPSLITLTGTVVNTKALLIVFAKKL